jgi:hypothetical protein
MQERIRRVTGKKDVPTFTCLIYFLKFLEASTESIRFNSLLSFLAAILLTSMGNSGFGGFLAMADLRLCLPLPIPPSAFLPPIILNCFIYYTFIGLGAVRLAFKRNA